MPPTQRTEFSAHVPTSEFEKFKRKFPQYGATTWFINATLAQFNQTMEEFPEAERGVAQAIEAMTGLNRAVGQL